MLEIRTVVTFGDGERMLGTRDFQVPAGFCVLIRVPFRCVFAV